MRPLDPARLYFGFRMAAELPAMSIFNGIGQYNPLYWKLLEKPSLHQQRSTCVRGRGEARHSHRPRPRRHQNPWPAHPEDVTVLHLAYGLDSHALRIDWRAPAEQWEDELD